MLSKAVRINQRFAQQSYMQLFETQVQRVNGQDVTQHRENILSSFRVHSDVDTLEANIDWQERKYPDHIGHWNPEHPDYVHAPRDEHKMKCQVRDHNEMLQEARANIDLQREVYRQLDSMDRPYLSGRRGIDRNVADQVQDYTEPVGHNMLHPELTRDVLYEGEKNQHRFINNFPFPVKQYEPSNVRRWKEEVENLPVNKNFNTEKGFKFDVPAETKYAHVADRLGHPEFYGNNMDRLLRVENDAYHPNFVDQPFVQTPPLEPHSSLNFREGPVLYDNQNAREYYKLGQWSFTGLFAYSFMWLPWRNTMSSNLPSDSMFDLMFSIQYTDHSVFNTDNYMSMILLWPTLMYGFGMVGMQTMNLTLRRFVTRVQYSEDRELLFITTIDRHGNEEVLTKETELIDLTPPSNIGAFGESAMYQQDGVYYINDSHSNEQFVLFKGDS
jgi:hypothetical protein